MKSPRCFWCDQIIEPNDALINLVTGKVECRGCREDFKSVSN